MMLSQSVHLLIAFVLVPAGMLVIEATRGAILPHLPSRPDTWNIQYTPLVLLALIGMLLSYKGLRLFETKRMFVVGAILNVLWLAFFTWAIVYLWGEQI